MSKWNYRIIKHIDREYPEDEVFYTVHEVYYNGSGLPWGFTHNSQTPRSKEEAEQMAMAFDKEPVAVVYEETRTQRLEDGFEDYEYEWLVPHGDM